MVQYKSVFPHAQLSSMKKKKEDKKQVHLHYFTYDKYMEEQSELLILLCFSPISFVFNIFKNWSESRHQIAIVTARVTQMTSLRERKNTYESNYVTAVV